jgi:hypothetical protein
MAGLVRAIHVFAPTDSKDVDARDIGVLSTPFFERLCAGMTKESLVRLRYTAGGGRPACMQAARSVFTSRHTIVIGPTPPGTGVMAPATLTASE